MKIRNSKDNGNLGGIKLRSVRYSVDAEGVMPVIRFWVACEDFIRTFTRLFRSIVLNSNLAVSNIMYYHGAEKSSILESVRSSHPSNLFKRPS